MTVAQVAPKERFALSPELLWEINRTYPELQAQDAFVVPTWYYRQNSWIEDSWQSENALYNYPIALRIHGLLDEGILRRSLYDVRRRQQVLRSVFRIMDGRFVQIVVPPQPVDFTKVDLSGLEESTRDSRLFQLILEEAHRPFELVRETLLRATLIQLGSEKQVLLLNTHHLVCDDWSVAILIRELSTLYHSFAAGVDEGTLELNFQYGDFIRWWEQRPNNDARLSSWRAKLSGGSEPFRHLRTDFPRSPLRSRGGTTIRHALPHTLEKDLKLLSQRHNVTFFMTMLAGFECLLHSYSGHNDIGVGTCAANRPLPAVETLVGRFANDLLVRVDFSGNPSFDEILLRTRTAALGGYGYQDVPFGAVLEKLAPVADQSHTPLFQVMFILQNAPKGEPNPGELTIERLSIDTRTAKYDLTVWLSLEQGVEIAFEYSHDLFEHKTIEQMAKDYETILTTAVRDSATQLSELNSALDLAHRPAHNCVTEIATQEHTAGTEVSAAGNLENELLTIWRQLLTIEKVDRKDDFFELGGDSLRATQLLSRLEQRFGIALRLDLLFTARTIEQQALAIAHEQAMPRTEGIEPEIAPQAAHDIQTASDGLTAAEAHDGAGARTNRKSLVRRSLNRILHILCRFAPGATSLRPFLHRLRGVKIGKGVWIGDDVYLENEYPERIEIQDGAMIALRSTIVAHTRGPGQIVIGKNVFIGVGCVIVTSGNRHLVIGDGAVVMASSLVSANVAPHTLYGSDAAKPLAKITKAFTDSTSYEELIASLRPLPN